jgi:hypothetical protein
MSRAGVIDAFIEEHSEASLSLGLIARISSEQEWLELRTRFQQLAQPLLGEMYSKR